MSIDQGKATTECSKKAQGRKSARCVLSLPSADHSCLVIIIDPVGDVLSFAIGRHLLRIFMDRFQTTLFGFTGDFLMVVVDENVLRLFEILVLFDLTDGTATGRRPRMRLRCLFTRQSACHINIGCPVGQRALMILLRRGIGFAQVEGAARCSGMLLFHGIDGIDQLRIDVDRRCVRCLPRMRVVGGNFRENFREGFAGNGVHQLMTLLRRGMLLLLKGSMENLVEVPAVQAVRGCGGWRGIFVVEDVVENLFVGRLILIGDVEYLLVDLVGATAIEDTDR